MNLRCLILCFMLLLFVGIMMFNGTFFRICRLKKQEVLHEKLQNSWRENLCRIGKNV